MAKAYIPRRQSELDKWAANFSARLLEKPAAFGVTAEDARAFASVYSSWQIAYLVSSHPPTRTTPAISAKDAARAALIAEARGIAQTIAHNRGVTHENKLVLGLNLPSGRGPARMDGPATSPVLAIIGATPGELTLRYSDQNTPASRAKPPGAIALELRVGTFDEPVEDPGAIPFAALVTRQPFAVKFSAREKTKIAYLAGRWVNARGNSGPWSSVVSFVVV